MPLIKEKLAKKRAHKFNRFVWLLLLFLLLLRSMAQLCHTNNRNKCMIYPFDEILLLVCVLNSIKPILFDVCIAFSIHFFVVDLFFFFLFFCSKTLSSTMFRFSDYLTAKITFFSSSFTVSSNFFFFFSFVTTRGNKM